MTFVQIGVSATRIATAALMLVVFAAAGHAQQSPTPEAIKVAGEIVTLKGADRIFSAIVPGIIEQGKNMFLQQDPALQKDLDEVTAKVRGEFAPRTSEILNQVARTYASRFTVAELKEILAFYKSPVGKKVIEQEVGAMEQSMDVAQEWATKLSDEVLVKLRAEMKKKGHDL